MRAVAIRPALPSDRSDLVQAIVELQNYERALHATRLPGEGVAEAYLEWLQEQTQNFAGATFVAQSGGVFVGFVVGWIETADVITETPDSNRFGYISDICVLPAFRGQGVAPHLLRAIERHLGQAGIARLRLSALAANASARACYERVGFTPYEVIYEKMFDANRTK